jgi:hypothetical protein
MGANVSACCVKRDKDSIMILESVEEGNMNESIKLHHKQQKVPALNF